MLICHIYCLQLSLSSAYRFFIVIYGPSDLFSSSRHDNNADEFFLLAGNFRAGEEGTIQKRLCGREQECLKDLMLDPLRPYVPEYRGQVCMRIRGVAIWK